MTNLTHPCVFRAFLSGWQLEAQRGRAPTAKEHATGTRATTIHSDDQEDTRTPWESCGHPSPDTYVGKRLLAPLQHLSLPRPIRNVDYGYHDINHTCMCLVISNGSGRSRPSYIRVRVRFVPPRTSRPLISRPFRRASPPPRQRQRQPPHAQPERLFPTAPRRSWPCSGSRSLRSGRQSPE